jgi:signal transduction histidine kinase
MHLEPAILRDSKQSSFRASTPVLLEGRWLTIARLVWLLIATLGIALFLASLPAGYRVLLNPCVDGECVYFQLSPEEMLVLHNMGFSLGQYAAYHVLISTASMLVFTGIALLIFWRRSSEWMVLLAGLWLVTFGATTVFSSLPLSESQPLLRWVLKILDNLSWVILLPLFLFLFPNGRFVPRWTRWIYLTFIGFGLFGVLIDLVNAHPDTPTPVFVQGLWFATQLTGVGSQVYRYRRVSDPIQRQQTKWVVSGLLATVLILALHDALGLPDPLAKLVEVTVVSLAFLIIPLSLGVSILRYRLWDIDLIINRGLIWAALTGFVVGMYVLVVGALGALFQARGTFLPAILATGLIALLFQPLRQRLQRGVNRLMYGERDEPYTVLSRLGRRLEETIAAEAMLPTVVGTVAHTLKLPYVAITLKEGHEFRVAASSGEPVDEPFTLPLSYQGETIGQLICGAHGGEQPFRREERRLLEDIARQAGVALHVVRLNADLQRSRERLVVAREEERRRIRRDLHDGLGPALASQTLKIGSARALFKRDPEAAEALLRQIERDSAAALEDIRRLVYNLRPPALDELGLLRAIQQDAPRHPGLDIRFELPPGFQELSAAVEVAVYRIVQEALANVVRHAGATHVSVQVDAGTELRLRVVDDGLGLPAGFQPGVGLRSMRERAEELGGAFHIHTTPGTGTTVEVRLPLREANI